MKIIVNGSTHETTETSLTYEEVVGLAGGKLEHNPSATFRVRIGNDAVREGILSAGRGVMLAEGMVFNVIVTGNA